MTSSADQRGCLDAPEAQGVSFNNIPPSTSKSIKPGICSGGEDTARISLWVLFNAKQFRELAGKLDALKQEAQANGTDSYYRIGFDDWLVKNSGFHLGGKGKSGPYFRWQLMFGGIRIGIANRHSASQRIGAPNVWVEIGSEVLMVSGGLKYVYPRVTDALDKLGGKIIGDVLSEVHACVDLPDVDIAEFCERFRNRLYVSRARINNTHAEVSDDVYIREHGNGLRPTGFELGSNIRLCVYEKRWEVRNSPSKKAILEKCRWGREVDKAVRVEFKMRRESLKSRGINTLPDWERERGNLAHWLTHDWFRMTESEVDRTNTSRANTWSQWEHIQALFVDWAGKGVSPPKLGIGIHLGPAQLIKQAAGCLAQAMVLTGCEVNDRDEFARTAALMLKGYTCFKDLKRNIAAKAAIFSAKSPTWAYLRRDSLDAYAAK